jgi:olefin beta-lactone synthetase
MVQNLVNKILGHASQRSEACCFHIPSLDSKGAYSSFTYKEFGWSIEGFKTELSIAGLKPGARVMVVLPVCFEMYSAILGVLAGHMTVVFFDRGLSLSQINDLLKDADVEGLLIARQRSWMKCLLPNLWRAREHKLAKNLTLFLRSGTKSNPGTDEALITFTSGTTGKPKGANRTHALLSHQHFALAKNLPESSDEVDMSCFPVFLLHSLGSALTAVFPKTHIAQVSNVDPSVICKQIAEYKVTRLSGAPAFMFKLCTFIAENGISLPSVRTVLVGGAPVTEKLCRLMQRAFPAKRCLVIYGSTEAEPIAHAEVAEVIHALGKGYMVGKPVAEVEFRITKLSTGKIDEPYILNNDCLVGEVGEVMVKGSHVLQNYINNHPDNVTTKIPSRAGGIWHRTGDLAYRDAQGNIWLQGRSSLVITTPTTKLFPFPVEAEVNELDNIYMSALTQIKDKPYLAYQLVYEGGADPVPSIKKILKSYGIEYSEIRKIKKMPVDSRHNSKVDRHKLAKIIMRKWF